MLQDYIHFTQVSSDEKFLPSDVSNQPQQNMNEDPTSKTNKELQIPVSIEKNAAEVTHVKTAQE